MQSQAASICGRSLLAGSSKGTSSSRRQVGPGRAGLGDAACPCWPSRPPAGPPTPILPSITAAEPTQCIGPPQPGHPQGGGPAAAPPPPPPRRACRPPLAGFPPHKTRPRQPPELGFALLGGPGLKLASLCGAGDEHGGHRPAATQAHWRRQRRRRAAAHQLGRGHDGCAPAARGCQAVNAGGQGCTAHRGCRGQGRGASQARARGRQPGRCFPVEVSCHTLQTPRRKRRPGADKGPWTALVWRSWCQGCSLGRHTAA